MEKPNKSFENEAKNELSSKPVVVTRTYWVVDEEMMRKIRFKFLFYVDRTISNQ